MADENRVLLAYMIGELREAHGWRGLSQAPGHIQYFVLNVKGGGMIESISEATYEAEHPDWAKAIRDDHAKLLADRENAVNMREAAELASNEAIKFIADMSPKQREKLMALLADEPAAPVTDATPVAEAKLIMAMCEKCGKEMPMMDAKLVEGKMVGKCSEGHDMEKPVEKPA